MMKGSFFLLKKSLFTLYELKKTIKRQKCKQTYFDGSNQSLSLNKLGKKKQEYFPFGQKKSS